jgi:hypothetical protein
MKRKLIPAALVCLVVGVGCNKDKGEFQKIADRTSGPIKDLAKSRAKFLPDDAKDKGKDKSLGDMYGEMLASSQACAAMKAPAQKLADMQTDDLGEGGVPRISADAIKKGASELARAASDCETDDAMSCIDHCSSLIGALAGYVEATSNAAKAKGVEIPRIDN